MAKPKAPKIQPVKVPKGKIQVTFNISERYAASKILAEFQGNLKQLASVFDDTKLIAITEEEWEKAGLVKVPILNGDGLPTGQDQWDWRDDIEGTEKEMIIDMETANYITGMIQKRSEAGELSLADTMLIELNSKLTKK